MSSSSWVTAEVDTNENIECHGYRKNPLLTAICWVGGLLSLGFLFLVFYWKEDWKLKCMCRPCHLKQADFVLIKDIYQRYHVCVIRRKLIKDNSGCSHKILHTVVKRNVVDSDGNLRFFKFHKIFFVLDLIQHDIFRLRGLETDTPCNAFLEEYAVGLTESQSEQRRAIYGQNVIHVRVRSIPVLLVQEVLNPFYMFQIFSVSVWLSDEYYYYSACILIMSAISISISLYTTRKQNLTLRNMVHSDTMVKVLRPNNEIVEVSEKVLVPGDVIVIPHHGCMMTCDALLIAGNCIVNESSLTGESVPVTKTPLSHQDDRLTMYSRLEHKRNSLFCGTKVIQTRQGGTDEVRAVVVQTGFSTAKGSLVQAIMYPKPMEFKLHRDALRFIGMLAVIALFGLVYAIIMMSFKGAKVERIIIRALDIITIAVPPALPAALTIGMVYAQIRLKAKQIFCISPQRINLSGTIDIFCFDKTGTLTEDGLDLLGVQMAQDGRFLPLTTSVSSFSTGPFTSTMATCHSLAVVNEELSGDPIDLKMFQATGWSFKEPDRSSAEKFIKVEPPKDVIKIGESHKEKGDYHISILRHFPFSSPLQRMSVIAQTKGEDHVVAYVKGSPEMIGSLSKPETVPDNFQQMLSDYTQDGFRVLALAWRNLDSDKTLENLMNIQRKNVEKELEFLGLMIMQNKLKPETKPVIEELNQANIRTVMITGDNLLTAINVARKCGMCAPQDKIIHVQAQMPECCHDDPKPILTYTTVAEDHTPINDQIPFTLSKKEALELKTFKEEINPMLVDKPLVTSNTHYAMDGTTYNAILQHLPDQLQNVIVKGTIFARFSPNQKMSLVEEFQHLEYFVGMCGDGANDCGALKTAHAGISLSEAEASVASPFTSKIPNISCVPILIRQGRAAIVTSFCMFKYMALYAIIQFITVMILYSIPSTMTDLQFHYIDLALCTGTILLVSRGDAYDKISVKRPLTKLMTSPVIFSLISQIIIIALIQTATFLLLQAMPWYVPLKIVSDERHVVCSETTSVFLVSCFQYIIVGVVYTPKRPFRQPLYKLRLYSAFVIVEFVGTTLLLYVPTEHTLKVMEMVVLPDYVFKTCILALALLNFVLACIIEYLLVPSSTFMRFVSCANWRKSRPPKYKLLETDYRCHGDQV
ncbi:probable cation-transporting ATPase 13A3 [Acanthaster planci]|uniref:Cation-transporting ATPase n=1 Tax=Acanthaster planci TaxID=133434 RepID=A0A8B7YAR3_ACAPL|nr:probable cation-transporting ATPase 13A3 [Acanthaster planci]XP_022090338.1 probable cation-transporting ATPase 13A3 [Acanthaster planci]XP_022090339.1 probable cation-transporting ATPase 13A3 [Acanthaster planci]